MSDSSDSSGTGGSDDSGSAAIRVICAPVRSHHLDPAPLRRLNSTVLIRDSVETMEKSRPKCRRSILIQVKATRHDRLHTSSA